MTDIKKIVGENIKVFIESRDLNKQWVYERAGIGKNAFYEMLNGKGNVDTHVAKLNKLFRLKDPMFFYKTNFDFTTQKNPLNRKGNFLTHVALSHQGDITPELREGFEVFSDFVELIDILKAVSK